MLVIVVALHCEAKPFIDALSLKRSLLNGNIELFSSQKINLLISGVGKIRSAVATSIFLSQFKDPTNCVIVNFGICAGPESYQIGETLLINKLIDSGSNKTFHPDILIRHPFNEMELRTFDRPQSIEYFDSMPNYLADMEASGFYEAASKFIPPSQVQVIKVLSDHFKLDRLSKEYITNLLAPKTDQVLTYIENIHSILCKSVNDLSQTEKELIEKVIKHLKLTRYQAFEVFKLAKGSKSRASQRFDILTKFLQYDIKSKPESKLKFEEIRNVLSST